MASASMPLLDEDTMDFGEEDLAPAKGTLTHPYVTLFHLAFRGAAVVTYMLCGWFSDSFITSFVVVVLLLSMDFWTVKNITGRLMVGLRWWNYVDDDGKSHWVFESRKVHFLSFFIYISKYGQTQNRINDKEASIFWMALILTPLLWSVFFLVALFGLKLKWLLLVIIALILNGANLYGYVKCKVGAKESISSVTTDFLRKQLLSSAVSMVSKQTAQQPNAFAPGNTV